MQSNAKSARGKKSSSAVISEVDSGETTPRTKRTGKSGTASNSNPRSLNATPRSTGSKKSTTSSAPVFSIRSDQKKRRVYTSLPKQQTTALHQQATKGEKEADFSYSDLSNSLYPSLNSKGMTQKKIDAAISTGSNLPIVDGPIPLNSEQNTDLQLIPHHILQYQKFHTPPNLTRQNRADENPFRQGELDFTQKAMQLPNAQGLKMMLPQTQTQVGDYFPGPIDISFPPSEENSLFEYTRNKAVYLLNKQYLLSAYQQQQDPENDASDRRINTDAFLETMRTQDDSTTGDPNTYLQNTLGFRRTEDEESLDEATDFDSSDDEAHSLVYDKDDDLETAVHKRATFLNASGMMAKSLNRKLLEDELAITAANGKRAIAAAKKPREKHLKMLARLNKTHSSLLPRMRPKFDRVRQQDHDYQAKRKVVNSLKEKYGKTKSWKKRDKQVEAHRRKSMRELKNDKRLLYRVGKRKLENEFSEELRQSKKRRT